MSAEKAIMEQKNAFHVNEGAQYEAPSSSENNMPPMGAENAVQTPAAAPHVTKSLF
jgi:hypothetical protein